MGYSDTGIPLRWSSKIQSTSGALTLDMLREASERLATEPEQPPVYLASPDEYAHFETHGCWSPACYIQAVTGASDDDMAHVAAHLLGECERAECGRKPSGD